MRRPRVLSVHAILFLVTGFHGTALDEIAAQEASYRTAVHSDTVLEAPSGLRLGILVDAAALGGTELEVAELTFPGGARTGGVHRHGSTELLYVLSGTLDHVVEGRTNRLGPGMMGIVRAGDEVRHTVVSQEPVRVLAIWAPGGELDRLRPAFRPVAPAGAESDGEGAPYDAEQQVGRDAVMAGYASSFRNRAFQPEIELVPEEVRSGDAAARPVGGDASPDPEAGGSAAPPAPSSACSDPRFREFDYWAGTWAVHNVDGDRIGTNTISPVSEGCALLERWQPVRGPTGISMNHYDPVRERWEQLWVGGGGLVLRLAGGLDGEGVMTLTATEPRATEGGPVLDRIRWVPEADGSVHQIWDVSPDGGESWRTSFVGIYRPHGS